MSDQIMSASTYANAYAEMTRRAEQAETALRESRRNHEESNDAHAKDIADLQRENERLSREKAEIARDRDKFEKVAAEHWAERLWLIQQLDKATSRLRALGQNTTGTNPATKDEQGSANPPGAGKDRDIAEMQKQVGNLTKQLNEQRDRGAEWKHSFEDAMAKNSQLQKRIEDANHTIIRLSECDSSEDQNDRLRTVLDDIRNLLDLAD